MTTATRRPTTAATATAPDWRRALCAQTDPNLFFPDGTGGKVKRDKEQAKRVCGRCPIRAACGQWAVETGQSSGVWGGMDEDERRDALSGHRSGQYERCIQEQEFIEERIAEGGKYQQIADELGVGRAAVCRAVKFFRTEREAGVNAA